MVAQCSRDDTITEITEIANRKKKTITMTKNLRPLASCGLVMTFILYVQVNRNYKYKHKFKYKL